MGKKAIFLDRDGIVTYTINGEAPLEAEQVQLIPETVKFIKMARKSGYLIVVVSNQPDAALGKINEATRLALVSKFRNALKQECLAIDAIYYCFHHPKGVISKYVKECNCKKPAPGMIIKAAKRFNIDLKKSFMIGDRASDIKAGSLAGIRTILVSKDNTEILYLKKYNVFPNHIIEKIEKALPLILKVPNQTIQALIPAGGQGTRMGELTKTIPKSLLTINEKPLMEYTLDLLSVHRIKEIGCGLFHLGEPIKHHFGDGKKFGVKLIYVKENKPTGTAGTVKALAKKLRPEKPFFVIAPDILNNFDLTSIYQFHQSHKGIATICCYWRPKSKLISKKSGLVVFDKNTKIIQQFIERPKTEKEVVTNWVNSSIYVFDPKILEYIPAKIDGQFTIDLPKDIFPKLLEAGEKLYAYPVNRKKYYQLGIDSPERITQAEKDLINKEFIPLS